MQRPLLWILTTILIASSGLYAGQRAPDFTLLSIDGDKFKLSERLEKGPVLIDFWATWCKPCLQAMPHLDRITGLYAERGLQVASISIDNPRSRSKVKPFIRCSGYSFEVLLDGDMEARRLFGGTNIPLTLLISGSGEVVYQRLGYVPGDENTLIQEIEKLLGSVPGDTSTTETEPSEDPSQ